LEGQHGPKQPLPVRASPPLRGLSFRTGLTGRHKLVPLHPQPGLAIRRQSPSAIPLPRFLCHHLPALNLSAFINPPPIIHRTSAQARMGRPQPLPVGATHRFELYFDQKRPVRPTQTRASPAAEQPCHPQSVAVSHSFAEIPLPSSSCPRSFCRHPPPAFSYPDS
jgi:hypothetical protein